MIKIIICKQNLLRLRRVVCHRQLIYVSMRLHDLVGRRRNYVVIKPYYRYFRSIFSPFRSGVDYIFTLLMRGAALPFKGISPTDTIRRTPIVLFISRGTLG